MPKMISKKFQDALHRSIKDYGADLLKDPRRAGAVLNDYCGGEGKRERKCFVQMLEMGFCDKLRNVKEPKLTKSNLVRQLHDDAGLDTALAGELVELLYYVINNAMPIEKKSSAENYLDIGKTYAENGDFDYDKAIQLDPDDAVMYNNRGYAYYDKGDFDKAIEDYDKAIQLDPDDADMFHDRGRTYYYNAALRIDPINEHVKRMLDHLHLFAMDP